MDKLTQLKLKYSLLYRTTRRPADMISDIGYHDISMHCMISLKSASGGLSTLARLARKVQNRKMDFFSDLPQIRKMVGLKIGNNWKW